MKYVYNGDYREFWGYIFVNRMPVEITDKATLERIKHEVDFSPVKETSDETQIQAPAKAPVLRGKECTKCHKMIPRGWYMHDKYCGRKKQA